MAKIHFGHRFAMIKRFLATVCTFGLILVWAAAIAEEPPTTGSCSKGVYIFAQIPTDFAELRPSQKEELSVLGLIARREGCLPKLVCVSASKTTEAQRHALSVCRVARLGILRSLPRARRAGAKDRIQITVVDEPTVLETGLVYVYMNDGILDVSR